jgi:hypothetical protein
MYFLVILSKLSIILDLSFRWNDSFLVIKNMSGYLRGRGNAKEDIQKSVGIHQLRVTTKKITLRESKILPPSCK